MKKFQKVLSVAAAVIMATSSIATLAACGDDEPPEPKPGEKTQLYNPDTRPLRMSISEPDGVFNPFFSTSAYDSEIISMTQASMLSSDKSGNITYGDNEPTVVLDYRDTTKIESDGVERTTYEFIIKNGMKFSDGEPLTIKDVLFNLYVYLDPVYTGSATIYSTDIVGLAAYRTQEPDADSDRLSEFEQTFIDDAKAHVDELVDFMKIYGRFTPNADNPRPDDHFTEAEKTQFKKDYVFVAQTFRDELYSDYNSTLAAMDTYVEWGMTDAWQAFLLNDGGETGLLATYPDGPKYEEYIKDEKGNFQLDEDAARDFKELLDEYLEKHDIDSDDKDAVADATKEWAVNYVFSGYFSKAFDENDDYDGKAFSDERINDTIADTAANQFEIIVRYWGTADTALTQFIANEKTKYFGGFTSLKVPTITGIDGTKTTTTDYHGHNLGEEHSVLSIKINGVDPKAIWNFAFTVAPLHYYSGTFGGKDYVATFDQERGNFGVKYGDGDFMTDVLQQSKNKLPLGAGPYKASTSKGGDAKDGSDFYNSGLIYYERNSYFETMGGENIQNAKIKYLVYKVVNSDQVINSLVNKEIDIGDPGATQDNKKSLNDGGIAYEQILTNGYGYIGINPRFVPNINVRRAIMKAFNTDTIFNEYYSGELAERINRPMTKASWAYPDGVGVYKTPNGLSYEFDGTGAEIEALVQDAGYVKGSDGVYSKTLSGFGVDRLNYTFTIAGGTTDHPAYKVFMDAMQLLNKHGFAIKVEQSATALTDLTAGKLQVWAAAWSSTIDPDMYQVYHMDSQATSVNNWGYKQIKANRTLYSKEYGIITELSELIDNARSITKEEDRAAIYSEALDKVMELAVEYPTYQRNDLSAYNAEVIDSATITPKKDLSPYNGLFSRIWEVNYK